MVFYPGKNLLCYVLRSGFDRRQTPISVSLDTSEIELLCAWSGSIFAGRQERWLGHVELCITSGRWKDIRSWLPLAQLSHRYNLGFTLVHLEQYRGPPHVCSGYSQSRIEIHRIIRALKEVRDLGLTAMLQGQSDVELRGKFEEWVRATLERVKKEPKDGGLEDGGSMPNCRRTCGGI
ncbi:hypothetical protein LTR01_000073 [Friedmanniomyces endolithicus]|nr:hypothetical protein LTR01_000073 [Friedmanniomyces endolithicus]